jgi:hypothetical protein
MPDFHPDLVSDQNGVTYKVLNGTYYHAHTPDEVCRALEQARLSNVRIKLVLGDTTTGKSWNEVYDVMGTVGRSMGPVKVPLLIHNSRSLGGGSVLDHCILAIRPSRKGSLYTYRHPKYTGNE